MSGQLGEKSSPKPLHASLPTIYGELNHNQMVNLLVEKDSAIRALEMENSKFQNKLQAATGVVQRKHNLAAQTTIRKWRQHTKPRD